MATSTGGRTPRRSTAKKATKAAASQPVGLSAEEIRETTRSKDILKLLGKKRFDVDRVKRSLQYHQDLIDLQVELNKLQASVQAQGRRVVLIFEGRDAAGKGGSIRRFLEHMNPRHARVVALTKPTELERGQWYFQRYVDRLPNAGEICFFDRSWYNRAVVEPVNGFCDQKQYEAFMKQVPDFERLLVQDDIELVKFWFAISKEEQAERFEARREDPLKRWKIGPVDQKAQDLWERYTDYKQKMFRRTHKPHAPWVIIEADSKKQARLGSIRHVLSTLDYEGKPKKGKAAAALKPDRKVVKRYRKGMKGSD